MAALALAFDILARDKASSELDKVGTSADKAGGKLGKFSAGGQAAFAGLATAAVVAGAAITKGLFDALDQGAGADVSAASLGLSPEDSAELGRIAGELYADAYGDSFGGVAEAVASVRSELGDLGADQLEGLTANALDFAAAFKTDVGESVGAAGILLRNGLAADGEEAFDLLTVAMQRVPASVRDEVLAATQEYSTFFADLGISGSEAFALISSAAEKGGNYGVDKVGDALKEFTIRATDGSKASTDAFRAIGADAEAMATSVAAGGDSARIALQAAVEDLLKIEDPAKQAQTAIALFGTPLEDLSVNEIPGFLDQLASMGGGLGDVEGATDAMGDTLNDNLKTDIEAWKRKGLQALADLMADKVIPAIERFAPVVQDGFNTAGPVVMGVVDTFRDLGEWVSNNKPLLIGLSVAVGGALTAAFLSWAASAGAAAIATLTAAAPVLAIGAAIGLLTAGIIWAYKNVDVFRGAVDAVAGFLTGTVWPIIQTGAAIFTDVLLPAIARIIGAWWDFHTGVFQAVGGVASFIAEKVGAMVGFFTGLVGDIANIAKTLWAPLGDTFRGVLNAIIDAWNRLDFGIDVRVPGWVPGIGGKGFVIDDVFPDIPRLHTGGVFRAPAGEMEGLALLMDGERVLPRGQSALGAIHTTVDLRGSTIVGVDDLERMLTDAIDARDRELVGRLRQHA